MFSHMTLVTHDLERAFQVALIPAAGLVVTVPQPTVVHLLVVGLVRVA